MLPENRNPTHPGEILLEEFLKPLGMTQSALAKSIGVPAQRINEIVRGKRRVSSEAARRLAEAFKTSPEFWVNLQTSFETAETARSRYEGQGKNLQDAT